MAGIRLDWAVFGDFDSFSVYRSLSPMNPNSLPAAIATGVSKTSYWDLDVISGEYYYYRVQVKKGSLLLLSDELRSIAAIGGMDYQFNDVWLLLSAQSPVYPSTSINDFSSKSNTVSNVISANGDTAIIVDGNVTPPRAGEASFYLPNNSLIVADCGPSQSIAVLEFFYKPPSDTPIAQLITMNDSGTLGDNTGFRIQTSTNGTIVFVTDRQGLGSTTAAKGTNPIANEWNHVCMQKSGRNIRCYVNGVMNSSTNTSYAELGDRSKLLIAGFGQYVSDVRLTRGRLRYDEAGFVPPVTAFETQ